MPKRYKKSRRNNRLKNRRTRRRYRKGGNGTTVKCCMCERTVNKNDTFVPQECLIKYGQRAHRICQDCWWDQERGFAREGVSHKCPGCVKGLPLTEYKKQEPVFVDLTKD